jgi:hypothetical protein
MCAATPSHDTLHPHLTHLRRSIKTMRTAQTRLLLGQHRIEFLEHDLTRYCPILIDGTIMTLTQGQQYQIFELLLQAATAEPPTTVSIGDVLHAAELLSKQTAFEDLSDDEQQSLRRALRRPLYRLRCKLAAFTIQIGTISSNDGCVIAFLLLFPEGELNGYRCDPQGGPTSQETSANRQPDRYSVMSATEW